MVHEMYERWLNAQLDDPDLKPELESIRDNENEIRERFAVALKFGTAGLRGVIGAGTNRMNIYTVRQATQGLANWVKTQGGSRGAGGQRRAGAHLSGADAGARAELCHALLSVQRRYYDHGQPQPRQVQRL